MLASAAFGLLVGVKRIWPYDELRQMVQIMRSLATHGELVAQYQQNPPPPGAAREVTTLHAPDRAMGEGYFALMGWDSDRSAYSVLLHDAQSTLQHVWPIDEMAISDRAEHRQNAPHTMKVLSDRSLVVCFDWLGLIARIDALPINIFHPNDLEKLGPELAPAFPMFEADRTISIYNNSIDRPRSAIINIDPATLEIFDPIAAFDGPFKSRFRSKYQRLPNGNRQITIPEQCQAIVVAPDGTLVMEFNNLVPTDTTLNDNLVNAKWYPADFFETVPTCAG